MKNKEEINDLEEAILKTLQYSNIFSYPLSFYQLALYLGVETNQNKLKEKLNQLVKKKQVKQKENIFRLKGKNSEIWKQKQKRSKRLFKKYSAILKKLEKIPWIKMVAITGSLAAYNPGQEDDVDILVITEPKRLWITRLLLVLYLKSWNLYRTDEDFQGKICPNILISQDSMSWPKEKRNYYIASEIVRIQPIINNNETYLQFLNQNDWIKEYFPNFHFERINFPNRKFVWPNILDIAEFLLFMGQKLFMTKKLTTERITKNLIHFNKNDRTSEILEKYNHQES